LNELPFQKALLGTHVAPPPNTRPAEEQELSVEALMGQRGLNEKQRLALQKFVERPHGLQLLQG
jgi:hypothetical protein